MIPWALTPPPSGEWDHICELSFVSDPFEFTNKVAIITGSTRGIGLATARLLATRGASVVISSRKSEACAAVCADFADAGLEAHAAPAHSARDADCRALVDRTLERFGRLDIVVANAGVNPVFSPLHALDQTAWDKTFDTNLAGPWRLARHALPVIAENGGGAMVMVSSINANFAVAGSGAYGVSKAALNALTRQLAVEWGNRAIRVNAVAPSTTRTDMIRALGAKPDFVAGVVARTPLRRMAEPEDIAGPICFLASTAARHVTGPVLLVDGGEGIVRTSEVSALAKS